MHDTLPQCAKEDADTVNKYVDREEKKNRKTKLDIDSENHLSLPGYEQGTGNCTKQKRE
jgi:hypothetical protein